MVKNSDTVGLFQPGSFVEGWEGDVNKWEFHGEGEIGIEVRKCKIMGIEFWKGESISLSCQLKCKISS